MTTRFRPATAPLPDPVACSVSHPVSRRTLVKSGALLAAPLGSALPSLAEAQPLPLPSASVPTRADDPAAPSTVRVALDINGRTHALEIDTRTTLLDALRENLALKGSKKGCDHGQCGACTVLIDGRRTNACLTLAVMHDGQKITTIEGLASGDQLHPMQAAFIAHDGYQCGYCTPGQICSSVGMLDEVRAGAPSNVTTDLNGRRVEPKDLSDAEIRERMSGNICRCSAYPNIVAAIRDVARSA